MIKKIISGGQTGADRAALDTAITLNIPHGGWIPKGRITEDGSLPEKYNLQEMSTSSYPKRTEQNVIDSNGTLMISHGKLTGGSAYTRKMAMKHGKPWFHADLNKLPTFQAVNYLIPKLSLKDKSAIAKMSEDDLGDLHFSFGLYIRNQLLYPRNDKLLESCRQEAMDKYLHWDQASGVIIKRIWKELKKSHKLKIVK